MEADKVDKFLLANESKFPEYEIPIHRLLNFTPEQELILETTQSAAGKEFDDSFYDISGKKTVDSQCSEEDGNE